MNVQKRCSLYYSHSWLSKDVDINLALWERISTGCELVVDRTEQLNPPYYISRIENYIRRSDAFLAVLLTSANVTGKGQSLPGDLDANCYEGSPYALFEVRLAERAQKPRLVLYDAKTRFIPGQTDNQNVRYFQFKREDIYDRDSNVWAVVANWLEDLHQKEEESKYIIDQRAALLLNQDWHRAPEGRELRAALSASGFRDIRDLTEASTDIEMLTNLRQSSLLVADLSLPSLWDIYGMAHALFIPSIRLFQGSTPPEPTGLPHIIRGHAAGYQDDVVQWTNLTELKDSVKERAAATRDIAAPIKDLEAGRQFFERRR